MKSALFTIVIFISFMFMLPTTVVAHVVVSPGEVGVGVRQNFAVGVPNEKDIPTVAVRLVIPEGLESVTPNVKPGWQIEVIKSGDVEDAKVTEIIWRGGEVGDGLRDEFIFRAKVPTSETTLVWKAYQTYSDGTVVAWEQEPNAEAGHGESYPYSTTKVVNDLVNEPTTNSTNANLALIAVIVSLAAVVFSTFSLWLSRRQ
ncbi:MAG: YcnI family protein [Candidatus Doudnabacteria bacterium]|nr:YcnI family protein [Candidatus Doudnabacteria bacterium]